MVACPECQFENPVQNRFCQRCGSPLKQLRAVITPTQFTTAATTSQPNEAISSSKATASVLSVVSDESAVSTTVGQLLTQDNCLKGGERYQLRQPVNSQQSLSSEIVLDILDCEPAAESPFTHLLSTAEEEVFDSLVPALALPYWKLQEHFFPMVPDLQAAWEIDNYTIVILEDRSTWRTLADFETSEDIEPLELVHWVYEIINLWDALTVFDAVPSLLSEDNLRMDDDQILCIQRLIYASGGNTYTLKDLGLFWQAVLRKLDNIQISALENLVVDIGAGAITNLATIKGLLANIADNLQDKADSMTSADFTVSELDDEMISESEADVDLSFEETPADLESSFGDEETTQPSQGASLSLREDDSFSIAVDDLLLSEEGLEDLEETEGSSTESIEESISDLPTMALPMKLFRLDEVGRTHVGRQRSHNEDFFFTETQLKRIDSPSGTHLNARGLYILCDGMGGHSGGEIASTLAVNTLRDFFAERWTTDLPDEAVVKDGILKANQVIFERNEEEGRSGNARMGTTLVMILISDNQAVIAHVGDSRLYCLNRQGLCQLTVDHEVGQREISRGVEPAIAYARPDAYQLTQALGPRNNDEVAPSISTLSLNQDALFILCSDGLSDNDLIETYAESHVEPMLRSRHDLEDGVAALIDLANEHNGHDNITAIAVRIKMRPNLEAAKEADQSLGG
ncbi:serine/threonine phosphatase [Oscillatoria sp. CS-180]|uniref:serine/threonine phosphatase n=1 Tax=Oscillatoria sp. CS-180 TaxID=3021720 RepID=UPI00232C9E2C|nr:serine/threonine phosphatase [Oscillatoria sp. CS-180]MDB9529033.1 serine/threonine phosphatase [Oscillatoria sp. CS-180]